MTNENEEEVFIIFHSRHSIKYRVLKLNIVPFYRKSSQNGKRKFNKHKKLLVHVKPIILSLIF